MSFNSSAARSGLTVDLTMQGSSAPSLNDLLGMAAGNGADNVPASTPASGAASPKLALSAASVQVQMNPLRLQASAVSKTSKGSEVSVFLSLHDNKHGNFSWSVASFVAGDFTFSDFMPGSDGSLLDGLAFTDGYAIIVGGAASVADVPMPHVRGHSLPYHISASPGVVFGATVQLDDVVPHSPSRLGAPTKAATVEVRGNYSSGARDMQLRGQLAAVAVCDGVVITSADFVIDVTLQEMSVNLNGFLTMTKAGAERATFQLAGSVVKTPALETAKLSVSANNWQFSKSIGITDLDGDLHLVRDVSVTNNKTTGNRTIPWKVTQGVIQGDFDMFGITLRAAVSVPFVQGRISAIAEIPALHVLPGVTLDNVEMKYAEATNTVNFSAVMNVSNPFGGKRLLLDVTGAVDNSTIEVSGTVRQWQALAGVLVEQLSVTATATRSNASYVWQAQIFGRVDIEGMTLALNAALPFDRGGLNLTVSGLQVAKGATFDGSLQLQEAAPQAQLLGQLSVLSGVASRPQLTADVKATIDGTSGFQMTGTIADWPLGAKVLVHSIDLSLNCVRRNVTGAAPSISCSGDIFGELALSSFGTMDVHIEVPLAAGGEVALAFPKLRLSSDAALYNASITYHSGGEVALDGGELELQFGEGVQPFVATASATLVDGCLRFTGAAGSWHAMSIGSTNLVVQEITLDVTACRASGNASSRSSSSSTNEARPASPATLLGSLAGTVDMLGGRLSASLAVAVTEGVSTTGVLELQWLAGSAPQGLSVGAVASAAGASATDVPSSNASDTVTRAEARSLSLAASLGAPSGPSLKVAGLLAFPSLGDLNFSMSIQRTPATGNSTKSSSWGFACYMLLSKPFQFSAIMPSSTLDNMLGSIQAGYFIVASHRTALTLGSGEVVSLPGAGVLFGAEMDLSSLGGGSASHVAAQFGHSMAQVSGFWLADANDFGLKAQLRDVPLGQNALLTSAQMLIQSAEPHFVVSGSVSVNVATNHAPLVLDAEVIVADGLLNITGSADGFTFSVGHEGIDVEQLGVQLLVKGGNVSGQLKVRARCLYTTLLCALVSRGWGLIRMRRISLTYFAQNQGRRQCSV